MSNKIKDGGMHAKRVTGDIITYIFLIVLSVIWLIPFFWLVMQSFRDGKGQFISTFLPKAYTVNNYKALFTQFDVMKALDEAATLDGCTRWQIFTKITLPLSKPMIVYQIITSFMAPWVDFVFAKVICRTNSQYFTVSIGLWSMLEKEYVDTWFVRFCAGAVLVSIPIAILFMITQKFYQEAMSGAVKG